MPRQRCGNVGQCGASVGEATQVESQTAKRASSSRYSGRMYARRESKGRSSRRIEWEARFGEADLAKDKSGGFRRGHTPKQRSSTLD